MENEPNPDLVGDLFWCIFKPQWIRLALTLDIFTPLASNPSSAEDVAQACGCDPFPIKALLDYFCAVNIIEKNCDLYRKSHTASHCHPIGIVAFLFTDIKLKTLFSGIEMRLS